MENIVDNEFIRGYLINSLANGRDDYLNILFLAAKKDWELVARLPKFYKNINIETGYYDDIEYDDMEFFNINILKSNEKYDEKNYKLLKELSLYYLGGHYDDFVIGYSYHTDGNDEAIIMSYHNGEVTEEKFILPKNSESAIINLTVKRYDGLKNTLQLKRVK